MATNADIRTPLGDLDMEVLFPRKKRETLEAWDIRLESYVTAWRTQGEEKATAAGIIGADAATVAIKWATYRGLSIRYKQLLTNPAQVAVEEEGSSSYTSEQIKALGIEAAAALAAVEAIIGDESAAASEPEMPNSSVGRVRSVW